MAIKPAIVAIISFWKGFRADTAAIRPGSLKGNIEKPGSNLKFTEDKGSNNLKAAEDKGSNNLKTTEDKGSMSIIMDAAGNKPKLTREKEDAKGENTGSHISTLLEKKKRWRL